MIIDNVLVYSKGLNNITNYGNIIYLQNDEIIYIDDLKKYLNKIGCINIKLKYNRITFDSSTPLTNALFLLQIFEKIKRIKKIKSILC